jgi:hypothetical protein
VIFVIRLIVLASSSTSSTLVLCIDGEGALSTLGSLRALKIWFLFLTLAYDEFGVLDDIVLLFPYNPWYTQRPYR